MDVMFLRAANVRLGALGVNPSRFVVALGCCLSRIESRSTTR